MGRTSQGSRGRQQKREGCPGAVTELIIRVMCCGGVRDGRMCGLLCNALGNLPGQVIRRASRARFCPGTLPPKPQVKTCITEAAVSWEQGAQPLLLMQPPSSVPAVWTSRHHLFFCTSTTNSCWLHLAVVQLNTRSGTTERKKINSRKPKAPWKHSLHAAGFQ